MSHRVRALRRGQWRTRDGTVIRCRDMSDRHLENAIRMCKRAHDVLVSEAIAFEGCLQGEMAIDAAAANIAHIEAEGPSGFEGYDNLIAERKRRGLHA